MSTSPTLALASLPRQTALYIDKSRLLPPFAPMTKNVNVFPCLCQKGYNYIETMSIAQVVVVVVVVVEMMTCEAER